MEQENQTKTLEETIKEMKEEWEIARELGIEEFIVGDFKSDGKATQTRYNPNSMVRLMGGYSGGRICGEGVEIDYYKDETYIYEEGKFLDSHLHGFGKRRFFRKDGTERQNHQGTYSKGTIQEGTIKLLDEQGKSTMREMRGTFRLKGGFIELEEGILDIIEGATKRQHIGTFMADNKLKIGEEIVYKNGIKSEQFKIEQGMRTLKRNHNIY